MRTDITWTDTAWQAWKDRRDHCADIAAYFGEPFGREHLHELQDRFISVTFAAGPCNVQVDGDGFLISTPHIVIGLVWTPDDDAQRKQRLAGHGFHYDNENTEGWPTTGHWSAHS